MSRIAREIDCQRSYLSRVIRSEIHLTPDIAYKISKVLRLNELEQDYFLTLVDWERSTAPSFKQHLQSKLQRLKASFEDLGHRTQRPQVFPSLDDMTYFSSWNWSAIHLWCSTPGPHTVESISKRFGIEESQTEAYLNFLLQLGYLEKSGKHFKYHAGAVHINKNSPLALINHSNWRAKALQSAQKRSDNSLHFTNLQTMRKQDYELILEKLRDMISETQSIAGPSEPEELVAICLDAFIV